jgi:hypothetical protein
VSILIGAFAGIGALQYAEVVAYTGVDPNTAAESTANPRQVNYYRSWHSIQRNLRLGVPAEMPEPRSTEGSENLRGAASNIVVPEPGCEGTSGQRLTKCNAEKKAGVRNPLTNETSR